MDQNWKQITGCILIVFSLLTLLNMENEAASDGIDSFGYPFPFYESVGGKCPSCTENNKFKPGALMADIGIAAIIGILIIRIKNLIFSRQKS